MGELTRKKYDVENEVELKSNVIRKRDKEIVEKERKCGMPLKKKIAYALKSIYFNNNTAKQWWKTRKLKYWKTN